MIPAHSPQAKGRVERLFKTLQDRLVKELRLAGVATLEEANRFLEGSLPIDNRRVAVPPAQAADLHRPRPAHRERDRILCLRRPAACARTSPSRTRGDSIRFTRRSGPPCVGGRARGWDDADHAPGSVARRARDHVSAREGRGGHTGSPLSAPGHAEAGPSVAQAPAARTHKPRGGGRNIKPDISTLEGRGHF